MSVGLPVCGREIAHHAPGGPSAAGHHDRLGFEPKTFTPARVGDPHEIGLLLFPFILDTNNCRVLPNPHGISWFIQLFKFDGIPAHGSERLRTANRSRYERLDNVPR